MKFGFGHIVHEHYQRHVELVQFAEEAGFDFAWVPDQTFFADPYVVLGAMALATRSIQLGVGVTNPYTRHPSMNARAIATVDQMSGGRAHLGIGAGNRKELLTPLGYDGAHAGPMSREMVEVVRGLLSNQVFSYQGKHFQVDRVRMDFEARPGLKLYIAGRGPAVLYAAGQAADGVIIGALTTDRGIAFALEHVRRGAAQAGRDVSQMEIVSWVTCTLTDDRPAVMERIRPSIAHVIGGAPMDVLTAIGLPADLMTRIKDVYAREGIPQAAEHVTDECIDALAIVGNAEYVSERIRRLGAAGVTQMAFLLPVGSVAEQRQRLQALAEQVLPAFR
jgi:5,10-methylenetetrahydromethanopterin reductase